MSETAPPTKKEHAAAERGWQHAIKKGVDNRGNLQINLDFLEETHLINSAVKALELGCGTGNLASHLQTQGVSMVAADISETAIEHARKPHP
ncbi:MAG: methyltransferase domain-containing protein, partial [Planctomycetota bacterium]